MLINLYNILGLTMFIWYSCFRWTLQGNSLGKITGVDFILNWWFAPINVLTAFVSIYFLIRSLFIFNKSFTENMLLIAIFLLVRNCWYTLEDIKDYITSPSYKQFFFIIIDIAMLIYCLIWIHYYRMIN